MNRMWNRSVRSIDSNISSTGTEATTAATDESTRLVSNGSNGTNNNENDDRGYNTTRINININNSTANINNSSTASSSTTANTDAAIDDIDIDDPTRNNIMYNGNNDIQTIRNNAETQSLLEMESNNNNNNNDSDNDIEQGITTTNANNNQNDNDNTNTAINANVATPDDNNNNNDNDTLNDEIQTLTNRLRILFFTLTLPIIPMTAILSLLLLQLIYAAITTSSCSDNSHYYTDTDTDPNNNNNMDEIIHHPLKLYAFLSLCIFLYTPNHKAIKRWLFNYDRQRDGMIRPRMVRIYDQLFHLLCFLYVYYGMILVEDCQDDLVNVTIGPISSEAVSASASLAALSSTIASTSTSTSTLALASTLASNDTSSTTTTNNEESVCTTSCPELYNALIRFVFVLRLFAVVFLLPVVCLPFVYLWIVRRINTEEAWVRFGHAVGGGTNGNVVDGEEEEDSVLVKDIMNEMRDVILVPEWNTSGGTNSSGSIQSVKIVEKLNHHHNNNNNNNNNNDDDETKKDSTKDMKSNQLKGEEYDNDALKQLQRQHQSQQQPQQQQPKIRDWKLVKDCCICMCEFDLSHDVYDKEKEEGANDDIEGQQQQQYQQQQQQRHQQATIETKSQRQQQQQQENEEANNNDNHIIQDIVETKCNHLFHKACIGSWIGGEWDVDLNRFTSASSTVRAQRRRCPLCREDLAPTTAGTTGDNNV